MEICDSAVRQGQAGSPQPCRPQVMIVSSVLLYREGLATSLATDGRLRVVATADTETAAGELARCTPQAVLIDATDDEALILARRLRNMDQRIAIVGFGLSSSATRAIACAEAGLAGFIDHSGTVDELVQTTLSALRGEFECSPRVTAILLERLAKLAKDAPSREAKEQSLTAREREIASLVSEGLSNKEIALDLRIGPATVKNHVHNILDKLGVRRRAAIAARVSETL